MTTHWLADDTEIARRTTLAAACDHDAFWQLDHPHRPMTECPTCGLILRHLPETNPDLADWSTLAEDRAHRLGDDSAEAADRAAEREHEWRWSA